jgi:hypothetical protein
MLKQSRIIYGGFIGCESIFGVMGTAELPMTMDTDKQ